MRRRNHPRGPRSRARVGFENTHTVAPFGAYAARFDDLGGTRVRLFAAPRCTPEVLVARSRRVPQ